MNKVDRLLELVDLISKGTYVRKNGEELESIKSELISQEKLLEAYLKQFDRELKDNNGLRAVIGIYSKAFEKIEALAFGEEGEWVDIINKISKDLHEAILAK